uniref:Si:ch211-139d20.3 n=1 Tax=Cyprinus carpio carpio TaxID=630221 RepID=A0A9J7YUT2_CYPCA
MGISKSRMKKVAPVSVTEETVCSSGVHRDESQLFGPSNTRASDLRVSFRRRAQADCNSEGQDSEFSADDLAEKVDRILAECDLTLSRTSYKMPMFGSKSLGLYYYAKGQDCNSVYSSSTRDNNEMNTVNISTSIHEKVRPPQDLLNCASIESTATASVSGIGSGSSVALPIMYDASEEDLMNTIEREFG